MNYVEVYLPDSYKRNVLLAKNSEIILYLAQHIYFILSAVTNIENVLIIFVYMLAKYFVYSIKIFFIFLPEKKME